MKKTLVAILFFISFHSLTLAENPMKIDLDAKYERVNTILDLLKININNKDYFKSMLLVEGTILHNTMKRYIAETEKNMYLLGKDNEKYPELKKFNDYLHDELEKFGVIIIKALEKK